MPGAERGLEDVRGQRDARDVRLLDGRHQDDLPAYEFDVTPVEEPEFAHPVVLLAGEAERPRAGVRWVAVVLLDDLPAEQFDPVAVEEPEFAHPVVLLAGETKRAGVL